MKSMFHYMYFTLSLALCSRCVIADRELHEGGHDDVCFPTRQELSKSPIKLTGWYENCNDVAVIVKVDGVDVPDGRTCVADYLAPVTDSVTLDVTGNTCYVNPVFDTPLDVFWLGPHVDPDTLKQTDAIALYYIGFSTRANDTSAIDTYMPKDCNAQGVCTCSSIDLLRNPDWGKEDEDPRHWCDELAEPGLTSCGSRLLNEAEIESGNDKDHCLLFGERFTFQSDNTTKQMFCDVNFRVSFDPSGLACEKKASGDSSGYTMMAWPAASFVGASLLYLLA